MVVSRDMAGVQPNTDSGILVEKINHSSGKSEWKIMPSDYDYSRELARASFADMLHDSERNKLYRIGLQAAIKRVKERGQKVRVLDIGTGTGLLSMMAAAEGGVDSIVACEEFRPMAECASKIMQLNGFKDDIKLVRKRSTDLTVGPGCDLEERANILVTEVFDTELIGEGAIGTYNHANQDLLTLDRIVVPGRARMYAQVVSSQMASKWNILKDIELGEGKSLKFGSRFTIDNLVLHDIQLSQMKPSDFTPLSEPIQVFDFDLACKKSPIPCHDQTKLQFTALESGVASAVLMWWDCYTDPQEQVLLSCAPFWSHPEGQDQAWRDHWMQAIYFPNQEIEIIKGESVTLVSNHDEYSLWFDVNKQNQEIIKTQSTYLPMTRSRLFQVNNTEANQIYIRALKEHLSKGDDIRNILCLGDQSFLGLIAAGCSNNNTHVTIVQENRHMRDILQNAIKDNKLIDKVEVISDIEELNKEYSAVVCDAFFTGSVLSWHNLLLWYHVNQLKKQNRLKENCLILPGKMSLWLIPVHYKDLWKIRAPLHNIEGFNMKHFDQIIDQASGTCDENVEPHPLWEYPCVALAQPTRLLTVNLEDSVPEKNINCSGSIPVEYNNLEVNGLALWSSWELTPELTINTGPCSNIVVGEKVDWEKGHKQGVHFFKQHRVANNIEYDITFLPGEGDFKFQFGNSD